MTLSRCALLIGVVFLAPAPVAPFAAPPKPPAPSETPAPVTAPAPSAAAPAAPAAGEFHVPQPTRRVLKNGLTVLVLERRTIPLIQYRVMVKSGSAADPAGREGTAALVARLLKRGTKSRPGGQFFEETEFVGGTIDTDVDTDASFVRGEFASRDVEIGFSLVADMATHPTFAQEEFDREKRLLLADLVGRLDDPETVARLAFTSWVYGAHPYGRPVDGTERSVQALTRADTTAWYEAHYVPNNAVLAIVGDVDAGSAMVRAEKYFGTWSRRSVPETRLPEPVAARGRKILLVDKPDATQSHIRFGNIGVRRADPDYVPLLVGNTVLGGSFTSWLETEVRVKRGLTYGIASRVDARRAAGTVVVSTFSKNATVMDTIKVSLDQVRRLRSGDLPAEDLDKARNFLAGQYPLRIESPDALADEILDADLYGLEPDFINQYQRRIRGTAADGVKRAVAKRVPLDDLAIVVVGPAADLRKDLESLGPVTVRPLQQAFDAAP